MEYLYSDEGQLLWLKGYCNPIRYEDLVARSVVPADLAAKLPDSTGAVFPTPAQLDAATKLITERLGRGRRRRRPVGTPAPSVDRSELSPPWPSRPSGARHRRAPRRASPLVLAGPGPVLPVRAPVPRRALASSSSAASRTRPANPTLQNYADLSTPLITNAFRNSIEVSLVTAIVGGIFGFLLAYAVILGGLPTFLRDALMTFSRRRLELRRHPAGPRLHLHARPARHRHGPAQEHFGIDLYASDFTIYSKLGLELVYLYFQFPLMVLIIAPAIDGLKPEWREAAENMGASSREYWRRVALPILTPTLLGHA